jgi:Protein of unknown function (DUF3251)
VADHVFTEPLPPGFRRTYVVDLAGVPPNRLGYVNVSQFVVGTVGLNDE